MTTVIDFIKKLRPNIKDKTLKNYVSSYNVCFKYFKDSDYLTKPKDVIKFYKERYPKITTRKTNLHAQALLSRAYNHLGSEKIFLKEAKKIEESLKKEKEKLLVEAINLPHDPPDHIKYIESPNKVISNFDLVKQLFSEQEQLVNKFYNDKKKTFTIKELKEISKLAIMALNASSFFEADLYKAQNPPRRLEYRFLKFHEGRLLKKNNNPDTNYLHKPNKKINIYKFIFNKYKAKAFSSHGVQKLTINSKLYKILKMYLRTHNKLFIENGLLFPQNMYNTNEQKLYDDSQWSKKIKSYFTISQNDIRKAFITKTYSQPTLPPTIVLKALASKMGHSLNTALSEYRKTPKQI